MESEKSGFVNEMSEIWRKMQVKFLVRHFFEPVEQHTVNDPKNNPSAKIIK